MRATFRAPARIPLAEWSSAARAEAEDELRRKAVELAVGAGADVTGLVEVPVSWRREDEPWRDPDGPYDAPLSTRTVMVGEASLEADVDDDGAPGRVTLSPEAAGAVHAMGVEADRARTGSRLVCGQPERRHQFPRHEALMMRDGLLVSSVCADCGRRVGRDELLRNAELEEAGVAWWTSP